MLARASCLSRARGTSISFGIQPEPDVPAPAEAMVPFFSGPLAASYVAEWHTGVIEELAKFNAEWAGYVVLNDQGATMARLRQPINDTAPSDCRGRTPGRGGARDQRVRDGGAGP